jgi:glycosyltransferase 2 family protein
VIRSRPLSMVLRLAVGIALIALLLVRSDIHAVSKAISEARLGDVVVAFVLLLMMLVVGAFRWRLVLPSLDLSYPTLTVVRLYFVGTFFNAFLPTGVGGDAYKAMRMRTEPGSLGRALASVFLDRGGGFVALALLGLAGAAWQLASGDDTRVPNVAAVLAILMLVSAAVLYPLSRKLHAGPQPEGSRFRTRVAGTLRNVAVVARDKRLVGWVLLLGVVVQGLLVAANVFLALALHLSVTVGAMAAILVITAVVAVLPLSINGLGLREGAYVWCLTAYGISRDDATAFAFLMLGLVLATSAIGGLVYVAGGGRIADRDGVTTSTTQPRDPSTGSGATTTGSRPPASS